MRFICVADTDRPKQVEVLSESVSDAITPSQLRKFAAMVRGEPVKAATLRTWRNRIGIHTLMLTVTTLSAICSFLADI